MAPSKYKDFVALQSDIVHSSLLEELIFWTFKYEFPQNFVCFLLNMLPDPEYKVKRLLKIHSPTTSTNILCICFLGATDANICNALQPYSKGVGNVR